MNYLAVLFDRSGKASPPLPCEIRGNGSELEIDAELSYQYVSSCYAVDILDKNQTISSHRILGYNFQGNTIINGVTASRCGQYILVLSDIE